jgi:transglutaminase-like putative cysteine protease
MACRGSRLAALFASLIVLLTLTLDARATSPPSFAIGPPPDWVVAASALPDDSEETAASSPQGRRNLLVDRQVRVSAGSQTYRRVVQRIVNESGLMSASQVKVEFDPSYQTLTFHSVVVRRGAEVLDRLHREAIRLAQREANLEAQVYDGEVSAVLFVDDLRVGDIVDASYSIEGADPTLGGRFSEAVALAGGEPILELRQRVLIPRSRHVSLTNIGPEAEFPSPSVRDAGDSVEYLWDLSHVRACLVEQDMPLSYQPFPVVEFSEFSSWQDVARLNATLFDVPLPASGSARAWAAAARVASTSDEDYILRAARFVQDEVRYVAIEQGMSRRRPADPATVFERRFGDCKDKTALLVALLRLGGVAARPVLVSTQRRGLDRWGPSPIVFDHAIVRVTLGAGAERWIDPTIALQGGPLARESYSPFERALTLDPDTRALDPLAPEPADHALLHVRDTFRVPSPEASMEARVESEHEYRNGLADSMRVALRSRSAEQIRKDYLELLQEDFPDVRGDGPVEVTDDRDLDLLRVVTHFAIPTFWKSRAPQTSYMAEVPARTIQRALARPPAAGRIVPLGLPYPSSTAYEALLDLPFDLPMSPQKEEVEAPGLRFRFQSELLRRRLTYRFALTTTASSVPVEDLTRHADGIARTRPYLLRALTYRLPTPDGPNWPVIGLLCVLWSGLLWGSRRLYLWNPPSALTPSSDGPVGLRGWLVLLGIGIFIMPFSRLYFVIAPTRLVVSRAKWAALTTPGLEGYHAGVGLMLVGEAVVLFALALYTFVLALAFIGQKRSFPMHFRNAMIAGVLVEIVDTVIASVVIETHRMEESVVPLLRFVVYAVVWTAYLHRSKRAAATFVR